MTDETPQPPRYTVFAVMEQGTKKVTSTHDMVIALEEAGVALNQDAVSVIIRDLTRHR